MRPNFTKLTREYLATSPLPKVDESTDKDGRGTALVIGGSDCVPGAALLAGIGALRAGAGKLQIATVRHAAMPLAIAVPEALVLALPTSKSGEIASSTTMSRLQPLVMLADAVLFGPGMGDDKTCHQVLQHLVPHLKSSATLILDSAAIAALRHSDKVLQSLDGRVILTPHAGEMASLMELEKADVLNNPQEVALHCAQRFQAIVVMKGDVTFIVHSSGRTLQFEEGNVGLATSGSGDTLAGIIAGLCARGGDAYTAAAWGVWAHGIAGGVLAERFGPVGFLAREILAEIPQLLRYSVS